jgi:hypothetical protein
MYTGTVSGPTIHCVWRAELMVYVPGWIDVLPDMFSKTRISQRIHMGPLLFGVLTELFIVFVRVLEECHVVPCL